MKSVSMFQSNTEATLAAGEITLQAIGQSMNDIPEILSRHFEAFGKQTTSTLFRGLEDKLLNIHHKLDQLPQSFVDVLSPELAGSARIPFPTLAAKSSVTLETSMASLHSLAKQLYMLQLKGLEALPTEQSEQLLQAVKTLLSSTKDATLSGLNVGTVLAIIEVAKRVRLQKASKFPV